MAWRRKLIESPPTWKVAMALDARQDGGEVGRILRMEVGRHDRDARLLGHRLEGIGAAAPEVGVLADDGDRLEHLLVAEIDAERVHHG
jgi:hypothetical protein